MYPLKRVLCAAFVLALLIIPSALADGYGKTTATGVRLRQQPTTDAPFWFRLPIDYVCAYETTSEVSGVTWYKVTVANPEGGERTYTGYLHGSYYRPLTNAELNAYINGTSGSSSSTGTVGATGMVTNGEVNIRQQATTRSASLPKVDRGTFVELLSISSSSDQDPWYHVRYSGITGYIQGPFIRVVTYGTLVTSPPTVTQGPSGTDSGTQTGTSGTVTLILSSVHLRVSPGGSIWEDWEGRGTTLPLSGSPVASGGYTWYPVSYKGRTLYARGDCVSVSYSGGGSSTVTDPGTPAVAPTPAPTANTQVLSGYVMTTKSGVNLRSQPAGNVIQQVGRNQQYPFYGTPSIVKGYTWYYVQVASTWGYLRSDCVQVVSTSETPAPAAVTPTPAPAVTEAPANPAVTAAPSNTGTLEITLDKVALRNAASPDAAVGDRVNRGLTLTYTGITTGGGYTWYHVIYRNREYWVRGDCIRVISGSTPEVTAAPEQNSSTTGNIIGYVRTTKSGVNVRTAPAGRNILGRVNAGTTYAYYEKKTASGYSWYKVNTAVGTGYIRSDCVTEVDSSGNNTPTATPTSGSSTNVSQDQVEATYATLKVGSSGTAVRNLVQELINQGYYKGSVTSEYTTAVSNAVKSFQSTKGLTSDGIADANTQHALFGTVAVGRSDYSDLSMVIYPAEKIDWFKGGIQELIPKGSNFKIYDVRTGIVWWAHRWSGGNHADIETLTAADTARLCRIYGVSRASDIKEKTHWQRRPCLVTIGTRTFACALYGVPHNSDGDTIPDNNLVGQVCLHFTNSRTHGSNKVVSYNEEAIEYAWQYAPNGHK